MRDAHALGLGDFETSAIHERLLALGREHFGASGEGVVRLEARSGAQLIASTRALGAPRETWRALTAPAPHPGPGAALGAKRAGLPEIAAARAAAEAAAVDEALLFDAEGRLVEGARSNLVLALDDGSWVVPPAARGAVRGVTLEAALAAGLALAARDVSPAACRSAREIVATNAVRGARPIVALDAAPVGDGRPGPLAAALAAALARG